MKITKERLNKIIKEELQKVIEGDVLQFRGHQEQDDNDGQLYDKPAGIINLAKEKAIKKEFEEDIIVIEDKKFYERQIIRVYGTIDGECYLQLENKVPKEIINQVINNIKEELFSKRLFKKVLPSKIVQNVIEIYSSQPNFIFKKKIVNSLQDVVTKLKIIEMKKQIN